jgi:HK97 family phage prohead protease
MNRAYSTITWRALDEDARSITGIASTPETDRMGDVVEPKGGEFKLPLPLLMHHDSRQPIGHVVRAKVSDAGIEIEAQLARIDEPGPLKNRLDEAWQTIKSGLVRGLSIGFQPLETARIEGTFGLRFIKWSLYEVSAVTIPANAGASISSIKSIDRKLRAAPGLEQPVVRLNPVGVPTPATRLSKGDTMAKTVSEQISALENKRAANVAAMQTTMQKSIDEGRSMDASEQEAFDNADRENDTIDADLARLKKLEKTLASTAVAVRQVETPEAVFVGTMDRAPVKVKAPDLAPGIGFTRLVKVKMASKLTGDPPLLMARRMYGDDSEVVAIITKANEVVAGTTISGNWAYDLISQEGAAVAAFLEYLRPAAIIGKFGTGNIPSLARLDFYMPYVTQTGGGDAYWVGEGKPKPLTAFDFDRSTLTPLKIANIAVLTEENIRYSSPNSDMIVRNALVAAIVAGLDVAFVDPANSGSAGVKPASITNGAESVVSTGDDEAAIRVDIRALFQKFIDANNAPTQGVWIMSATNALALAMMVNTLGQPSFPGMGMTGGVLMGLPVIVSQHIGDVVALVAADQIFLGDEGGVAVDMSREASIEMRSAGLGMDATAGTATAASVSMFQTNSVALRAERTINWKRARTSAVAYLSSVDWGGAVPES